MGLACGEATPRLFLYKKRNAIKLLSLEEKSELAGSKITRVVVADDHEKIRAGIRALLNNTDDIMVIGEARDGLEALRLVEELRPDILLLDMEMPVMKGNEVATALKEKGSPVRILALSAYDDQQYILSILENGASGYLTKEDVPETLINALRGVAQGQKGWINQRLADKFAISSRLNNLKNLKSQIGP